MIYKNKLYRVISVFFLLSISFVLITFPYRIYAGPKSESQTENRTLTQRPTFTVDNYISRYYQDELESYLSDQFIGAGTLKKNYIGQKVKLSQNITSLFYINSHNVYVPIGGGFFYYKKSNTEKMIVTKADENMAAFKGNVFTLNELKAKALNKYIPDDVDKYYYLANLSGSYDFTKEEKNTLAYDYMKQHLHGYKTDLLYNGTFDEYEKYFWKTDHHWNYKGIYKGYRDIIDLMQLTPLKPISQLNKGISFQGESAKNSGYFEITDDFSAYYFQLPDFYNTKKQRVFLNMNDIYKNQNNIDNTTYYEYYGSENVLNSTIINPSGEGNCLILGTSMSNGMFNFIAAHFNKTIIISNYSLFNQATGNEGIISEKNEAANIIKSGGMEEIFAKMYIILAQKMEKENIDTFLYIDGQTQPFAGFSSLEDDKK